MLFGVLFEKKPEGLQLAQSRHFPQRHKPAQPLFPAGTSDSESEACLRGYYDGRDEVIVRGRRLN